MYHVPHKEKQQQSPPHPLPHPSTLPTPPSFPHPLPFHYRCVFFCSSSSSLPPCPRHTVRATIFLPLHPPLSPPLSETKEGGAWWWNGRDQGRAGVGWEGRERDTRAGEREHTGGGGRGWGSAHLGMSATLSHCKVGGRGGGGGEGRWGFFFVFIGGVCFFCFFYLVFFWRWVWISFLRSGGIRRAGWGDFFGICYLGIS